MQGLTKDHRWITFAFQIAEIRFVKFSWPLILHLRFSETALNFWWPLWMSSSPLPGVNYDWSLKMEKCCLLLAFDMKKMHLDGTL